MDGNVSARWKTVWITGASTGIGRELSLQLARGGVRVAASARSREKLEALAAEHANITAVPLDVTIAADAAAAHARISAELGPIDLAVLNAGVWDQMGADNYDAAQAMRTMAVNYGGAANALAPLLTDMRARRSGHIAIVASVAGYRGLPKSIGYAPSKAALISLAEVLRLDAAPQGITVSLINPGFVDTPMTAVNKFPMPFMITAQDAAARILRGLERQKFEIVFPWSLALPLKILRALPYSAWFALARRLSGKM